MSSRRENTRIAILDAAWKRLSTADDEARLEDVAADAGVSRQSVYLHFGSRGALLVALVDHIDERLGLADTLRALDDETDPAVALRRGVQLTAMYQRKIQPVAMALYRLGRGDADAAAAYEDRMAKRRAELERRLTALHRAGRLAPGWTARRAADALWAAGAPPSCEMLVADRGWSTDDLERWFLHLVDSLVIDAQPSGTRRRAPRPTVSR